MANTIKVIYAKLTQAGISPTDYYRAAVILNRLGLENAKTKVVALNKQRRDAVVRLARAIEEMLLVFGGEQPFGDERALEILGRVQKDVEQLQARTRRAQVERTMRVIEHHIPLNARDRGELAAFLSAKGISYVEQAQLLLTRSPVHGRSVEVRSGGEDKAAAVKRIAANLKTLASRSRNWKPRKTRT